MLTLIHRTVKYFNTINMLTLIHSKVKYCTTINIVTLTQYSKVKYCTTINIVPLNTSTVKYFNKIWMNSEPLDHWIDLDWTWTHSSHFFQPPLIINHFETWVKEQRKSASPVNTAHDTVLPFVRSCVKLKSVNTANSCHLSVVNFP
jgi:hypothetical protein